MGRRVECRVLRSPGHAQQRLDCTPRRGHGDRVLRPWGNSAKTALRGQVLLQSAGHQRSRRLGVVGLSLRTRHRNPERMEQRCRACQHRRYRGADHRRQIAGGREAGGRNFWHSGQQRSGPRQIQLPMDVQRRQRVREYRGSDGCFVHAASRGPGQDRQVSGVLYRPWRLLRVADQRCNQHGGTTARASRSASEPGGLKGGKQRTGSDLGCACFGRRFTYHSLRGGVEVSGRELRSIAASSSRRAFAHNNRTDRWRRIHATGHRLKPNRRRAGLRRGDGHADGNIHAWTDASPFADPTHPQRVGH